MKTNLVTKYDYITLSAIDAAGNRLNMTWNRRGTKISGGTKVDPAVWALARPLMAAMERPLQHKGSLGDWAQSVQLAAAKAEAFPAFLTDLQRLGSN